MKKIICFSFIVFITIGITSCAMAPFKPLVLDELWYEIEYFDFENADEDDWRELLLCASDLLAEAEKELEAAGGHEYSVEIYKNSAEHMRKFQEDYREAKENGDIKEMQRNQIQISAYKEDSNSDEYRAVAQLIAVQDLYAEILEYIYINYPDMLQEPDLLD